MRALGIWMYTLLPRMTLQNFEKEFYGPSHLCAKVEIEISSLKLLESLLMCHYFNILKTQKDHDGDFIYRWNSIFFLPRSHIKTRPLFIPRVDETKVFPRTKKDYTTQSISVKVFTTACVYISAYTLVYMFDKTRRVALCSRAQVFFPAHIGVKSFCLQLITSSRYYIST